MNTKGRTHNYLLIVLFSWMVMALSAAPARKNPIQMILPDGSRLTLLLTGDEFFHTYQTEDGLPVAKGDDGYFYYQQSTDGALLSTGVKVHNPHERQRAEVQFTRTLQPLQVAVDATRVNVQTKSARAQTPAYRMNAFPLKGQIRGVVLLVAFADVPFCQDSLSIHTLLANRYNTKDYSEDFSYTDYSKAYSDTMRIHGTIPGSARDYFYDQSLGQFDPVFDVFGPITLTGTRATYGANNAYGSDINARGMVKEACQIAYDSGLTDFSVYDNDRDGFVDYVYVVYSGSDEAQFGEKECIWAHSSSLMAPLSLGKAKILSYACSAELLVDLPHAVAGIGTFVHEFGHVLGLPDFYNTSKTDFCMDSWSVMDYGCYNKEGFVPCAYTAFERYSMGWIPMKNLESSATFNIRTVDKDSVGYRAFVNENDTTSFYLFDNIQKEKWNTFAPTYGLMISQVTYSASNWRSNTVNTNERFHRHYVVPANNVYAYKDSDGKSALKYQLYGHSNVTFSPTTTPASVTQTGDTLRKSVEDILLLDSGRVSFDYNDYSTDIVSNLAQEEVQLTLQGARLTVSTKQGGRIEVYAPQGVLLYAKEMEQNTENLDIPIRGICFVKVNKQVKKLVVK